MNPTEFWTLALCICGVAQCFFLAACFGVSAAKKSWMQLLPALLMLLLGVRILKSVIYLLEGEGMSLLLMNIGFAAHLTAAPVLYFYLLFSFGKKSARPLEIIPHFLPALVILLMAPWLKLHNFWYVGGYYSLLFLSLGYWTLSLRVYLLNAKFPTLQSDWYPSLLLGTGVFFFAYFANYILGIISYSTAPVIYSLAIFPIGISAWRNFQSPAKKKLPPPPKYRNLSLSAQELERGC